MMPHEAAVHRDVATALIVWQETADDAYLESIVSLTAAHLEQVARRVLRRHHVDDWSAVDDTLSLVLDHLRRLPLAMPGERSVARFDATRPPRGGHGDPGLAYLVWLVRERALDVARRRRRRMRHGCLFADVGHLPCLHDRGTGGIHDTGAVMDDDIALFHAALDRLEPRLRTVVEWLLEGKTQTVIAHALGVCEGTVSRLRARAIAEVKRLLAE